MKSELGTDGSLAGEAMLTSGEFDKISDVLRATTTAASIFQTEFSFNLAGHDDSGAAGIANMRLCDSLTQAKIHGNPFGE
jgi:hypothetical protein